MRENPKPQEIYRHFKGNIYQIITLAYDSETMKKVVVYQQLYSPYKVYVRDLEMFMSKVNRDKYPNEKQHYRFEKLDIMNVEKTEEKAEKEETQEEKTEQKPLEIEDGDKWDTNKGFELDEGIVEFLDADSYEKKLEILSMLHPRITDEMINTMAVSLDTEIKEGDIETRYNEIKNCLITMERFECNRLR
jgi:hypothetical protein